MLFRFAQFTLDSELRQLERDGERLAVEPKVFDLILQLVQARGRVSSADELLRAVWPDVRTTVGSLSRALSLARAALGDRERRGDPLIQTVRGRGYRITVEVQLEETDAGAQAFIGRRDDLEQLHHAFDGMRAGRGGAVFVAGAAGIGKSRLLDEFAAHARSRGARVLWSSCFEGEGSPGFWPWTQILTEVEREFGAERLRDAVGEDLELLAGLVPAFGASGGGDRARQFGAVNRLLAWLCEQEPVVLVIDDAHWADESSLGLLRFIASASRARPVLVLAAYRPAESPPAWSESMAYCASVLSFSNSLQLRGLSRDEVGALYAAVSNRPAEEAALDALLTRTEGHPFFVRELVLHGERGSVPHTVRDASALRLARLVPATVELLQLASAEGREFEADLLARAAKLPMVDVIEALSEAIDHGLIEPWHHGFRFEHAIVWEAVLQSASLAKRLELHRSWALALATLPQPDVDALARHCGAAGMDREAARYGELAAERATAQLAFERAIAHYSDVLRIAERSDAFDERHRCEILIALGDAQYRAGEHQLSEATSWRAVEAARALGAVDLFGSVAEQLAYRRLGNYERVPTARIALFEETLERVGDSNATLRARLLAGLSVDLYWTDFARSQALSHEALGVARHSGDRRVLLTALDQRYQHVQGSGEFDLERQAINDEMLELARTQCDLEFEFYARKHRFHEFVRRVEPAAADSELGSMAELAERLVQATYREEMRIARVARALWRGELDAAEAQMTPPDELVGGSAQIAFFAYVPQLFVVRRMQGRVAELEVLVREGVTRFPLVPAFRAGLAVILVETDRAAEARAVLDEIARDSYAGLPVMKDYPVCLAVTAVTCARVGSAEQIESLYARLAPHAGQHLMTDTIVSMGAADRYLGLLAAAAGRAGEAVSHFEAALEIEARLGSRPWAAYAHRDLAVVLEHQGDASRARSERETATRIAAELALAL